MEFFEQYQDTAEGFWTYCEAENEQIEIPNIEGSVVIKIPGQEKRMAYLRLIHSLLTFSTDSSDIYFRGFADIRYYGITKSEVTCNGHIWYEIELKGGSTSSVIIFFTSFDEQ